MKILMAPVNIAGQPIQLVDELRRQDVDVRLLQYGTRDGHAFGYKTDMLVDPRPRPTGMLDALKSSFHAGYDLYHFWLRTLYFCPMYHGFTGLDVPLIKARGKRVVYRFTGFDLRLRTEDMAKNRFSPFHYGYNHGFDEELQRRYIDFLGEYVDQFVVQDPEMQDFFPEAHIIPRVMNLEDWQYVGVRQTDCPLVVHAPSSKKVKGSGFVGRAVEELKSEGLHFRYREISGMSHAEAKQWYERADIIIDQLLIGWYGVLTLEGMALGKPVIVYVREELLDNFDHDLPIHNANPETIREQLRVLIRDSDLRTELGRRSRKFVEGYHDVRKVASNLKDLYCQVLDRDPVQPTSGADVDYYELQLNMMRPRPTARFINWRNKAYKILNLQNKRKYMAQCVKRAVRVSLKWL
jgi:hypothetical protein